MFRLALQGFLLFRLASRYHLIPSKLQPSRLFVREFKAQRQRGSIERWVLQRGTKAMRKSIGLSGKPLSL